MKRSIEELISYLKERELRPSYQRLKILGYLLENRNHPTADEIYESLHSEIPTLSKSTVYNSLNVFVQARLVKQLTIEDSDTRYDIDTQDHGHFKCELCGRIYNFKINIDGSDTPDLKGFNIKDRNVNFTGTCPSCLKGKEIRGR